MKIANPTSECPEDMKIVPLLSIGVNDFARKNLNNNDVSRETVFSLYHYDIIVMLRSSKRHRAGPYHQGQRIN